MNDALNTLKDPEYIRTERSNRYLRETSRNNTDWQMDLMRMANERKISLDSMTNIYLHDRNFKPE